MSASAGETRPPGAGGRNRLGATLVGVAGASACFALALYIFFPGDELTDRLFRQQDFPALLVGAVFLAALALWRARVPLFRRTRPALVVAGLAVAVALAAWAGIWLVFGGYTLTRDEIMADFDAAFMARGLLIGPLPTEWSEFAHALMPRFMLPIPSDVGWLSAYLPGNAALRALGAVTLGAHWVNPLLAALSVVATYRIGRRLWPDDAGPAVVAAVLLASSAQVLTMAMTAYAMSAHLAFNLLWLWAFLRDDRRGDAAALAAGFVATGLHQIVFHPLFILPFLIHLWWSGRRQRALVYVVAYAAIGLFWASYWQILLSVTGGADELAASAGTVYLIDRVLELLRAIDPSGLLLMAFNLARLLSWQNIVLLPLAVLSWPALRRGDGIARPLAAGILLTTVAMFVLLPWQAHGWGYRYMHGLIGSLCLLAGYGWKSLAATPEARWRGAALAAGTAASLLVILPFHLKQTHDLVAPYRRAYAAIGRSGADIVLVDDPGLLYAEDLVRNAPDLSNRPKIMAVKALTDDQLRRLCSRYRLEAFDWRHGQAAGIPPHRPGQLGHPRRPVLNQLRCAPPLEFGAVWSTSARNASS